MKLHPLWSRNLKQDFFWYPKRISQLPTYVIPSRASPSLSWSSFHTALEQKEAENILKREWPRHSQLPPFLGGIFVQNSTKRQNFPSDSFGRIFLPSCTPAKCCGFCHSLISASALWSTLKKPQQIKSSQKPKKTHPKLFSSHVQLWIHFNFKYEKTEHLPKIFWVFLGWFGVL